jgi:hypothetical protein
MQNTLPNLMREKLPDEFIFEQIPHITTQLIATAEKMQTSLASAAQPVPAAGATGAHPIAIAEVDESAGLLSGFIQNEILPFLTTRKPIRHQLYEESTGDTLIRLLKVQVSEAYRPQVQILEEMVSQRRQMALQIRLQRWLHGWLLLHVPLSLILLVFTAWHAIVAVWNY